MPHEDWDESHGFASPGEFRCFRRWVTEAVEEGALVEIPVATLYSGSPMFEEHWYRAPSGVV